MKKSMYYAVYDIADNGVRTSVIHALKNHGMVRIQKSVFCGSMSVQQKKDLAETIKMLVTENDSFYLMLSCSQCFGKVLIIGRGFDREYVADRKGGMII